jgi:hypothetical protein
VGRRVPAIPRSPLWRNRIGVSNGSAGLRNGPGEGAPVNIDLEPFWTGASARPRHRLDRCGTASLRPHEQRLVDVPFQVTGPDELRLQLPAAATIAPPGWYLVFVVDPAGLASEAELAPPDLTNRRTQTCSRLAGRSSPTRLEPSTPKS